jgi:hypothetical protein
LTIICKIYILQIIRVNKVLINTHGNGDNKMKKVMKYALTGAAMSAMTTAAAARCEVEIMDINPNGTITVQQDVYVNNSIDRRLSGTGTYQRNLSEAEQRAIPQLEAFFAGKGDNGAQIRGQQDGVGTDRGSGSNERRAERACNRAFNSISWPTVRIPETPRVVTPPSVSKPRPKPAPAPRVYVPTPPETSLRPPQICKAENVQPVIVIQTECDCDVSQEIAEAVRAQIESDPQYADIDVVITEGDSFVDSGPVEIAISVQNEATGTVQTHITDENGALFSLVGVDDDRDGEIDRQALIALDTDGKPDARTFIENALTEMKYAPFMAATTTDASATAAVTMPANQDISAAIAACKMPTAS